MHSFLIGCFTVASHFVPVLPRFAKVCPRFSRQARVYGSRFVAFKSRRIPASDGLQARRVAFWYGAHGREVVYKRRARQELYSSLSNRRHITASTIGRKKVKLCHWRSQDVRRPSVLHPHNHPHHHHHHHTTTTSSRGAGTACRSLLFTPANEEEHAAAVNPVPELEPEPEAEEAGEAEEDAPARKRVAHRVVTTFTEDEKELNIYFLQQHATLYSIAWETFFLYRGHNRAPMLPGVYISSVERALTEREKRVRSWSKREKREGPHQNVTGREGMYWHPWKTGAEPVVRLGASGTDQQPLSPHGPSRIPRKTVRKLDKT